ncbi:MAG TPA: hypothetical protein VN325_23285 [Steroidobacteraceae bacterium]|nr:hypothetical protein [Steroidobacteraceae bacterium]
MDNGGPLTKEMLIAWIARGFLVAATTIGVPITGYMLTRVLEKSDEVVVTVHSHDTSLEVLKQGNSEIKDKLGVIHDELQDHENRIRSLERPR